MENVIIKKNWIRVTAPIQFILSSFFQEKATVPNDSRYISIYLLNNCKLIVS